MLCGWVGRWGLARALNPGGGGGSVRHGLLCTPAFVEGPTQYQSVAVQCVPCWHINSLCAVLCVAEQWLEASGRGEAASQTEYCALSTAVLSPPLWGGGASLDGTSPWFRGGGEALSRQGAERAIGARVHYSVPADCVHRCAHVRRCFLSMRCVLRRPRAVSWLSLAPRGV